MKDTEYDYSIRSIAIVREKEELLEWALWKKKETAGKARFMIEKRYTGLPVSLIYKKGILQSASVCKRTEERRDITGEVLLKGVIPCSFAEESRYGDENHFPETVELRGCMTVEDGADRMHIYQMIGNGLPDSNMSRQYLLEDWGIPGSIADMSFYDPHAMMVAVAQHECLSIVHSSDSNGIVLKIDQSSLRKDDEPANDFYGWAIAYRWKAHGSRTTIIGLHKDIDRDGKFLLALSVYTVVIDGVFVGEINPRNIKEVYDANLHYGDSVVLALSADRKPYIKSVDVSERKPDAVKITIPERCPYCSARLEQKGDYLFCSDEFCPQRAIKQILHVARANRVSSVSPFVAEKLVENGMYDASDFLYADEDMLHGYGIRRSIAKKIVEQSEAARERKRKKRKGK